MSTRLTTDAVQIVNTDDAEHTMAVVTGRNGRTYVVDRNPRWSSRWICTCGWDTDGQCAHIRVAREKLNG